MANPQNLPTEPTGDRPPHAQKSRLEVKTHFVTLTLPVSGNTRQLRDQIEQALQPHGQPLRWAIAHVEPQTQSSPAIAHIEAVVTQTS